MKYEYEVIECDVGSDAIKKALNRVGKSGFKVIFSQPGVKAGLIKNQPKQYMRFVLIKEIQEEK